MSTNSAIITPADGGIGRGVNTGIGGTLGTVDSGSLLPIGTATHWSLEVDSGGNLTLSVDAAVTQITIANVLVVDTELDPNAATFTISLGVSSWTWTGQLSVYNSFGTGDPTNVSLTALPTVSLAAPTVIDGTGVLLEWTAANTSGHTVEGFAVYRDGEIIADDLDPDTLTYSDQTNTPNTQFTYYIALKLTEENDVLSNEQTVTTGDLSEVFNCDCETVSAYSTLAELRIRMAIQCGYAAMASNLPTGQAAEFNEYLYSAQKQLYLKFRAQRTERFFNWTMVPGQRYYALADSEGSCTLKLDPLAVTWVGFEDLNRAWYRLVEGIDPVYYTRANINFGWPTRYEIRSCIEVFPAPQAAYTLWIKGDIGLAPFTSDSDRTTFDDEAVLLFAIANWKSAKGKVDVERCMGQATQRIQDLTARKHGTYRYVPSTYVQNPATPPRFLPLGSQQA